jgi:hypothetical protein
MVAWLVTHVGQLAAAFNAPIIKVKQELKN